MAESLNLYYEGYEKSKNYDFVRFNASRPLQSRELNDVQLIAENRNKMLSASLFENGTTLSGTYKRKGSKIELSDVSVVIDSIVYDVSDQSISFKQDQNIIAIKVEHKVIDSSVDSSLSDPFIEGANGGIAGADRRKFILSVKSYTPFKLPKEFTPIARIEKSKCLSS